ncbi:hypothetical protein [Streptomyces sp. CC208A]|uniref:phage tail protein n=1 Tax=Streptomyces sp. CC208A TaxID=3044573 RepID=UPI0024A9AA03|nr:hypothetical protein [Streptomyces sp. CC208A]
MALTIGELVGIIRADDSGWRSGLAAARLRLRGLTRDADGQLRDLRGRFVSEGEAAGRGLANRIRHYSGIAVTALKKIGPAAAGIGVGIPAVAALTTAIAGLAAGAVAAGLAVGAFSLAVKPQMEMMQESADAADKLAQAEEDEARKAELAAKLKAQGSDLATKAEKAYQTARLKTKEAELAYQRQTAGMPKATREAALAQAKLKLAHEEWSESLADTTMPVFTKGLNILRDLLPVLTPFVKAAAGALDDMLDRVAKGVKSAKFKEWTADMAEASGPALSNFIQVIANLGRGFMGLMQAFLPTSDGITGGLVDMTDAFADWAQGLKGSEGFEKFLDIAREGGGALGQLALAAGNLLVALGPLIGVTAEIALAIANIINSLPPDVLAGIAAGVTAVALAFKAYQLYALIAAGASLVLESRLWMQIGLWLAAARTAVASMLAMARAAVVHAATTAAAWLGAALRAVGTFALAVARAALAVVGQMAMMAARAVVWAATMAAQWLIAMGPIGWIILAVGALVTAIIVYWDEIKAATVAAWDWLVKTIKQFGLDLIRWFTGWPIWATIAKHWQAVKDGSRRLWDGLMNWLRGLPGRIIGFFAGWSIAAVITRHWQGAKDGAIRQGRALLDWMRNLPREIGRALGKLGGLLVSHGRDIVRGLWEGIKSMGGWIKSQVGGFVRTVIPGPIASMLKIASPSKVTAKQGEWVARGLVVGMTSGLSQIRSTAAKMANIIIDATDVTLAPRKKRIPRKQRKEVKGTEAQKKRAREQNKKIDEQNREIDAQNRKIDQQNKKIDEQNKLLLQRSKSTRTKAMTVLNAATAKLATLAKREEQVAAKLKAANAKLADLVKARNALAADVKKSVLDAADITQNQDEGGTTATSILANLQANLAKAKKFAEDLATLRKKGVRADLIAQIAQAGMEQGSASAAALAAASSGQIKQINDTQAQLVKAATQAGDTAGDAMYGAGIRAAQGLVEGLKKEQSAIERQMLTIATAMQKAIKQALGIKSPSRVMAAVGRFIPAGLVRGIESGRSAVDQSMSNLVKPPTPTAVSGAYGGAGAPAATGRAQAPTVIEVRSGGSRMDDLLVEVLRNAIKDRGGDVQLALGQRR